MRILLADDDPDDQLFARQALEEARVPTELRVVGDGLELMHYLRQEGRFRFSRVDAPPPDLILLDLNMPRMNGHEALKAIRADPQLRVIPVVVLTTSSRDEDVRTYELGGNSFITKPSNFPELVEVIRALDKYWLQVAELPSRG